MLVVDLGDPPTGLTDSFGNPIGDMTVVFGSEALAGPSRTPAPRPARGHDLLESDDGTVVSLVRDWLLAQ